MSLEQEIRIRPYVLGSPKSIMHHTQSSGRILVIMSKPTRKEKFHHGRSRGGFHPYEGCQSVSVDAHHNLQQQKRVSMHPIYIKRNRIQ